MAVTETISMPMQSFLQAGLGTLVSEVLDGAMISDYDIQAFRQAQSKKDVAKIALVRGLGKLTSAATLGAIHAGDIENYRKTGSLKQTVLKKNLVDLALTGAVAAFPALSLASATLRRVLPEFTVEDAGKKAQQLGRAAKRRFGGGEQSGPSYQRPSTSPYRAPSSAGATPSSDLSVGAGGGAAMPMPGTASTRRDFNRGKMQALRQRRAATANVASLDDEKLDSEKEQEQDTSNLSPRGLRTRLNADRKASKEFRKKTEEAVKARARTLALKYGGKIGLRVVNAILGFSGIGLIIVFFVMLYQGFFGNLLNLPGVTKLSGFEIGILIILGALFFALYILTLMLVTLFSDPWSVALIAVQAAIEKLFGN